MIISIVIRTLNESRHLEELLAEATAQQLDAGDELELVIIDSGSTDSTLEIAASYGCRITHIAKDDFTFGRSLNDGTEFSTGDIVVYVSGHCVPATHNWLQQLVSPIKRGEAQYSYGRQIGRSPTKFSEKQLFAKYYPEQSRIVETGFFCNNANSAILRDTWQQFKFDEQLTGLEDMELAKRLVESGGKIAYSADAVVYHIHDESWTQTRRRYERESIALQKIMPEVHVSLWDAVHYVAASVYGDCAAVVREGRFLSEFFGIIKFRVAQYWGTYRGNHEHRQLSRKRKNNYYYPNKVIE